MASKSSHHQNQHYHNSSTQQNCHKGDMEGVLVILGVAVVAGQPAPNLKEGLINAIGRAMQNAIVQNSGGGGGAQNALIQNSAGGGGAQNAMIPNKSPYYYRQQPYYPAPLPYYPPSPGYYSPPSGPQNAIVQNGRMGGQPLGRGNCYGDECSGKVFNIGYKDPKMKSNAYGESAKGYTFNVAPKTESNRFYNDYGTFSNYPASSPQNVVLQTGRMGGQPLGRGNCYGDECSGKVFNIGYKDPKMKSNAYGQSAKGYTFNVAPKTESNRFYNDYGYYAPSASSPQNIVLQTGRMGGQPLGRGNCYGGDCSGKIFNIGYKNPKMRSNAYGEKAEGFTFNVAPKPEPKSDYYSYYYNE